MEQKVLPGMVNTACGAGIRTARWAPVLSRILRLTSFLEADFGVKRSSTVITLFLRLRGGGGSQKSKSVVVIVVPQPVDLLLAV